MPSLAMMNGISKPLIMLFTEKKQAPTEGYEDVSEIFFGRYDLLCLIGF